MGASKLLPHADRVRRIAGDDKAPAISSVAASWRRSLALYGLDPGEKRLPETVTASELSTIKSEMAPLLRVAQPVLDRLFRSVGGSGCCVLLTDRNGVTVDRRGAPGDDEVFYQWRLWPAAVWSEAQQGTNGIGTCLAEGRALAIQRDEHFHARNTDLSCIDAPIYDHCGRLAAALDVSSCRADLNEAMLGLIGAAIADAARTIETLNFHQAFPQARIVLAPDAERSGAALLAVDRDDLVVGATRSARLAFAISDERIAGQLPAADVLAGPSDSAALLDAERGAVKRALARADGNVSAAARALGVSRATLHRKLARLGLGRGH